MTVNLRFTYAPPPFGPLSLGSGMARATMARGFGMLSLTDAIGNLFVYGDSILVYPTDGTPWPTQIAAVHPATTILGTPSHQLRDDCPDATTRNTFISSAIAPYTPDTFWDEMGINDWATAFWTTTQFGAAKAGLWDALQSQFPDLHVYAQTMTLDAGSESTNPGKGIIEDWRQAIRDIAASRSTWVTVVEWGNIDIGGGIHPTQAGANALAASARALLGV